jgi:transcriptional regulator with GAF, ATPase, and Fis domain/tetratricopeptide (TPR) repeat protein
VQRSIPPDLSRVRPDQDTSQHEAIGDLHLAADNFAGAVDAFQLALRDVGPSRPAERCRILDRLAEAWRRRGDYDAAIRALTESRELARLLADPRVVARIAGRMSQVHADLGRYRSSRRYALFAYRALRDTDDHETVGHVSVILGFCCARLGHSAEAIDWLQSAAATFRRIDDNEGLVSALNNLGLVYKNLREWREATRFLEQALRLDERAGFYARMRGHHQNLGLIRYRLGQWDLAEENFRQSLKISRDIGHAQGEAVALLALGMLARRRRELDGAEQHFQRGLELAQRVGARREELLAREFLGELALDRGDPGSAERYLSTALPEAERLAPGGDLVAELETRLAQALLALGRHEEAHDHARRGAEIAERIGDRIESAIAERTLARIDASRGNYAGLESRIRLAAQSFETLGETYELASTLAGWGEALFDLPKSVRMRVPLEPVIEAGKRAAALFRELGVVAAASESLLTLARLESEREHYDQALTLLERAEHWLGDAGAAEAEERAKILRRELEQQYVAVSLSTCNEFRALEEANRLFRETTSMDGLLAGTVRLAVEHAGGDRGFVAFSGAAGRLDVVAQHGLGRDRARRILHVIESVGGTRLAERGPIFSSRVTADPRFASALTGPLEGVGSLVCVPLNFPSQSVGVVFVDRLTDNLLGPFRQRELNLLAVLANTAAVAMVEAQRSALMEENRELRDKLKPMPGLERVVTESREMSAILKLLQKVGDSTATILFMGETGTGKGLLAKVVHEASNRRDRSFVQVNCAALPEQLLESELFGYVQGAFTGAVRDKSGLFEEAQGGTIFLDEIEKVPESVQAKLLHVLDSGEIRPVGATRNHKVDARVICATGCDLRERIREGRFLEDLYYRLNDISVRVPPLRERRDDIPLLTHHFLALYARQMDRPVATLSPRVMRAFLDYEWRGNVRELEKTIKRLVVLGDDDGPLDVDLLPPEMRERAERPADVESSNGGTTLRSNVARLERDLIARSLDRSGWNKARAARELGLSYPTLLAKIRIFRIEPAKR